MLQSTIALRGSRLIWVRPTASSPSTRPRSSDIDEIKKQPSELRTKVDELSEKIDLLQKATEIVDLTDDSSSSMDTTASINNSDRVFYCSKWNLEEL